MHKRRGASRAVFRYKANRRLELCAEVPFRQDSSMKAKVLVALLSLLYLLLFIALAVTFNDLPERMATHFSGDGRANGWMSRTAHLWFTTGLGLGLPGAVVGICYAIRFFPVGLLNIPHRDYWMAPERRGATYDFIFHHSLWLACLAVAFVIGIHLSIVQANKVFPPMLASGSLMIILVGFVTGVVVWSFLLLRRFFKVPERAPAVTSAG